MEYAVARNNTVWAWLKTQDVVTLTLAASIFMSAFEYLFSVDIAGTEIRIFQLLILLLFPLIITHKRSSVFFIFANFILGCGVYYSVVNGYFDSPANMMKILLHQEMSIITICIFLSVNYARLNIKLILQSNFYAIIIGSCLGLLQFVLYNLFSIYINLSKYDMGEHLKWRIFGFFSEPNMYSLYYVLALPLFYCYLQFYHKRNLLFKYSMIAIVFAALFLSFSRGALLAVIWMAFNEMVKNKSKWFSLLLVAFMILFGVAFSMIMRSSLESNESLYRLTSFDVLSDPSSSGRIDVFISLYNYYQSYGFGTFYTLMLGNGLSSFRVIAYPFKSDFNYFAMNLYVDLLFEHGVIALAGFIAVVIKLRRRVAKSSFEVSRILRHTLPAFLIVCLFYPIRTVLLYQLPFLFSIGVLFFCIKNNAALQEKMHSEG